MGPSWVDLFRVFGAVAMVAALVVLFGLLARRGLGSRAAAGMKVVERLPVARGVQLMIVNAGGRRLLIGVSDKAVNLVTELDEDESPDLADDRSESSPGGLVGVLDFGRLLAGRLRARGGAE